MLITAPSPGTLLPLEGCYKASSYRVRCELQSERLDPYYGILELTKDLFPSITSCFLGCFFHETEMGPDSSHSRCRQCCCTKGLIKLKRKQTGALPLTGASYLGRMMSRPSKGNS